MGVEKGNLVGQQGGGWDVAKHLLAHEREMIGSVGDREAAKPLGQQAALALGLDATGRLDDAMLRAQIAEFECDESAFRLALERAGDMGRARQGHPAMSSMLKYYGAELNKRRWELMMAIGGTPTAGRGSARSRPGDRARTRFGTKAQLRTGGATQGPLQIISKRIFEPPYGLPPP